MCKVSSGSVQWDCEQFPQSKSGELGREQQGLRALIILGAHSAPLCLQSLTVQGWTRSSLEVPSSPYNSVILCDITRAKGFTHLLAALQKHIFSRTEHSIQ